MRLGAYADPISVTVDPPVWVAQIWITVWVGFERYVFCMS